jgi:hypothetical protein
MRRAVGEVQLFCSRVEFAGIAGTARFQLCRPPFHFVRKSPSGAAEIIRMRMSNGFLDPGVRAS